MRIGDLRKRIEVQIPTRTPDGMGGYVTAYTTHGTIWAAIWPLSAKEIIQAKQLGMVATHKIRIRYRNLFRPGWRIKYGDRYFSINGMINPSQRNRIYDLVCKETSA